MFTAWATRLMQIVVIEEYTLFAVSDTIYTDDTFLKPVLNWANVCLPNILQLN